MALGDRPGDACVLIRGEWGVDAGFGVPAWGIKTCQRYANSMPRRRRNRNRNRENGAAGGGPAPEGEDEQDETQRRIPFSVWRRVHTEGLFNELREVDPEDTLGLAYLQEFDADIPVTAMKDLMAKVTLLYATHPA